MTITINDYSRVILQLLFQHMVNGDLCWQVKHKTIDETVCHLANDRTRPSHYHSITTKIWPVLLMQFRAKPSLMMKSGATLSNQLVTETFDILQLEICLLPCKN